jgi:7-cyano-7-deazaguanine tRNA-ribosyltransferase
MASLTLQSLTSLAIHNLHVLIKELKLVKQAIKEGRLWELLEYRSKAHPSLHEAFEIIKKYVTRLLEKYSSIVNPGGKALLLIDLDSEFNPRVKMNVRRALQMGLKRVRGRSVILIPAYRKPYNHQTEYVIVENILRDRDDVEVFFVHPILGLIMPRLSSTYPYYQHETRITSETISPRKLATLIEKLASAGAKRLILVEAGWLMRGLYERIQSQLKELRGAVVICKTSEISSLLPPRPSPPSPSQPQ